MRIRAFFIGLFIILLLGVGCNRSNQQNGGEQDELETTDTTLTDSTLLPENTFVYEPNDVLWEYQLDSTTQEFKPVKLREVGADTLTAQDVEAIVNEAWPNVQIDYLETAGDTVYIEIPESMVLTQQMGTAGAKQFLVSTTYSFTELGDVEYVAFDFKEGDHAVPGVYNRKSWDNR